MHQEMPVASPRMLGLQLWVNLPKKDKMVDPKYRNITQSMIPIVHEEKAHVRVVAGEYAGVPGAVQPEYVQARFLDVDLEPGAVWRVSVPAEETVFAYVFQGKGHTGPDKEEILDKQAVLFGKGEQLVFTAGSKGLRMALLSAPPLGEPVAWGGPIVMNTDAELRTAFFELEDNTFIKHTPATT